MNNMYLQFSDNQITFSGKVLLVFKLKNILAVIFKN